MVDTKLYPILTRKESTLYELDFVVTSSIVKLCFVSEASCDTVKELSKNSKSREAFTMKGGVERDGVYFVIKDEKVKEAETNVKQWLQKIIGVLHYATPFVTLLGDFTFSSAFYFSHI